MLYSPVCDHRIQFALINANTISMNWKDNGIPEGMNKIYLFLFILIYIYWFFFTISMAMAPSPALQQSLLFAYLGSKYIGCYP